MCLKLFILANILLTLLCRNANPMAQIQMNIEGPARDISKYRILGPLVLGHTSELRRDSGKKRAEIRQFIWESFKKHILSNVTFTSFTLEGNKIESSIFIEPDKDGVWHVHLETRSEYKDHSQADMKTIRESQEYDAYMVVRLIDIGGGKSPRILSDSDPASSREYELRLMDKDGKRITEI